jgi:hypothetical protein
MTNSKIAAKLIRNFLLISLTVIANFFAAYWVSMIGEYRFIERGLSLVNDVNNTSLRVLKLDMHLNNKDKCNLCIRSSKIDLDTSSIDDSIKASGYLFYLSNEFVTRETKLFSSKKEINKFFTEKAKVEMDGNSLFNLKMKQLFCMIKLHFGKIMLLSFFLSLVYQSLIKRRNQNNVK